MLFEVYYLDALMSEKNYLDAKEKYDNAKMIWDSTLAQYDYHTYQIPDGHDLRDNLIKAREEKNNAWVEWKGYGDKGHNDAKDYVTAKYNIFELCDMGHDPDPKDWRDYVEPQYWGFGDNRRDDVD